MSVLDAPGQVDVESGNSQKKALQPFIFPQGGLHVAVGGQIACVFSMHNEEKYPNMLTSLTDID